MIQPPSRRGIAAAIGPSLRYWRRVCLASLVVIGIHVPAFAQTAIVTDGSLGPAVDLGQGDVEVSSDVGTIRGANLFHSFQVFDIGPGDRATFAGPGALQNVIARVTGGAISRIDGTLASTIGQADVWLVNPAGIAFGPTAGIDVPAGLHISTADGLNFADDTSFSATNPGASTLSLAAPTSFGFLGASSGRITISGSDLAVTPEAQLSLIASDIEVTNATAAAPDGTLLVAARRTAGNVPLDAGALPASDGTLRINGGATLSANGGSGGNIRIRAADVILDDNARILAERTGATGAAVAIDIAATELSLGNQSRISADSTAAGQAGAIILDSPAITLANASTITSDAVASGDGGTIDIATSALTIEGGGNEDFTTGISTNVLRDASGNGGQIVVDSANIALRNGGRIISDTRGIGDAGTVSITARDMTLDGAFSSITTTADPDSEGNSGAIEVRAENLNLLSGGQIGSGTFAVGDGGSLSVVAGAIIIDAGGIQPTLTGLASSAQSGSTGNAGPLDVTATSLSLRNGGTISTSTFAAGDGGSLAIRAQSIDIDGAGNIDVFTGITSAANAGSTGDAGAMSVDTDNLRLTNGGRIISATFGAGAGSTVILNVRMLDIDGGGISGLATGLFSSAEAGSQGGAGSISLTADSVRLSNGGAISSSTSATGAAGELSLQANRIIINGGAETALFTGIASSANRGSTGAAGTIMITGESLDIRAGGRISNATSGSGDGGLIAIESDRVQLDGPSTLLSSAAESTSDGDAGTIAIAAKDVRVSGGGQITSSTGAGGSAGSIVIEAGRDLTIAGSADPNVLTQIASSSLPGASGPAGSVRLSAPRLNVLSNATVTSSSSAAGLAGDVIIRADRFTSRASRVATFGADNAGGRIDIAARQTIDMTQTQMTTSGLLPAPGASLLTLRAPFVRIIGASQIESIAGPGVAIAGAGAQTGAARVAGAITIVSDDSVIAASNNVSIQGLDSEVGSGLQLTNAQPADTDRLLSSACAARSGDGSSSFARTGTPRLAVSPTDQLGSSGGNPERAEAC